MHGSVSLPGRLFRCPSGASVQENASFQEDILVKSNKDLLPLHDYGNVFIPF